MSKPRGKIVKLNLRVDAELNSALEKAGFANLEHFIDQSVKALLEVHGKGERIQWPVAFTVNPIAFSNVNPTYEPQERQA